MVKYNVRNRKRNKKSAIYINLFNRKIKELTDDNIDVVFKYVSSEIERDRIIDIISTTVDTGSDIIFERCFNGYFKLKQNDDFAPLDDIKLFMESPDKLIKVYINLISSLVSFDCVIDDDDIKAVITGNEKKIEIIIKLLERYNNEINI